MLFDWIMLDLSTPAEIISPEEQSTESSILYGEQVLLRMPLALSCTSGPRLKTSCSPFKSRLSSRRPPHSFFGHTFKTASDKRSLNEYGLR